MRFSVLAVAAAWASSASAAAVVKGPSMKAVNGPASNKQIVLTYYDELFNKGNVAVVDQYLRPDFIQHNPSSSSDPTEIKNTVIGLRQVYPESKFEFFQALAERDLVAVHAHFTLNSTDVGQATFDVFRLQDGMIAEHWDAVQPVTTSVSGNDMFNTVSEPVLPQPDPRASAGVTCSIASAFYNQVFIELDAVGGFDTYAGNYIQHNPLIANGPDAAKTALGDFFQAFPDLKVNVKRTITEGDLIIFHSNFIATPGTLGTAVIDMFRVRDGKVVEHWDVVQDVPDPSTSANQNGMF